jgi:hypothetical protein
LQQENEAADRRKRNIELEHRAISLAAAQAQHSENVTHFDADFNEGEQYLNRRLEEIDAEADALQRERDQVRVLKDEYERKKLRIESEAEVIWRVIGEAAERTKAWEGEVRDQVALEKRVAKVRSRIRPGSSPSWAAEQDDDLSDVPF